MKKWYKLSLASLVIPATAGVTLVSVGCPSNTDGIPTPTLVDNPSVVVKGMFNAQAWWDSLGGTPLSQVIDAPNSLNKLDGSQHHLFVEGHGLNGNEISNVKMTPSGTTFKLEVTLREGKTFTDGSNTWTSGPIEYIDQVDVTQWSTISNVQGSGDAKQWVNAFNNSSTNPETFGQVLNKYVIGSIESITCSEPNSNNQFNITVKLKKGYQFSDGVNSWTSSSEKNLITFHHSDNFIEKAPELNTNWSNQNVYAYDENVNDWFNTLGDSKAKFDTFFKAYAESAKISDVTIITSPESNEFSVAVDANNYIFTASNSSRWVSGNWHYIEELNIPQVTTTYSIDSKFKNAAEWFASLNDATDAQKTLQNKYDAVSKLFTFDEKYAKYWNVSKIKNIKITDNAQEPATQNFTVTIELQDGYAFDNTEHTTTWTTSPINYSLQLPTTPVLIDQPKIAKPYLSPQTWVSTYNNNLSALVGEINQILTPETALDATKVKEITVPNTSQQAGLKFNLGITLQPGYVFQNNEKTWNSPWDLTSSSNGITYAPTYPNLPALSTISIYSDPNSNDNDSVQNWWNANTKNGKATPYEKFKLLRQYFIGLDQINIGDLETQVGGPINNVELTPAGNYDFSVSIKLQKGALFQNGTDTWTSSNVNYQVLHKDPAFRNVVTDTYLDDKWLQEINADPKKAFEWAKAHATTFDLKYDQLTEITIKRRDVLWLSCDVSFTLKKPGNYFVLPEPGSKDLYVISLERLVDFKNYAPRPPGK